MESEKTFINHSLHSLIYDSRQPYEVTWKIWLPTFYFVSLSFYDLKRLRAKEVTFYTRLSKRREVTHGCSFQDFPEGTKQPSSLKV